MVSSGVIRDPKVQSFLFSFCPEVAQDLQEDQSERALIPWSELRCCLFHEWFIIAVNLILKTPL